MGLGNILFSEDYDFRNALHLAAANGKMEVIEFLVSNNRMACHEIARRKDRWDRTYFDELNLSPYFNTSDPKSVQCREKLIRLLRSPEFCSETEVEPESEFKLLLPSRHHGNLHHYQQEQASLATGAGAGKSSLSAGAGAGLDLASPSMAVSISLGSPFMATHAKSMESFRESIFDACTAGDYAELANILRKATDFAVTNVLHWATNRSARIYLLINI